MTCGSLGIPRESLGRPTEAAATRRAEARVIPGFVRAHGASKDLRADAARMRSEAVGVRTAALDSRWVAERTVREAVGALRRESPSVAKPNGELAGWYGDQLVPREPDAPTRLPRVGSDARGRHRAAVCRRRWRRRKRDRAGHLRGGDESTSASSWSGDLAARTRARQEYTLVIVIQDTQPAALARYHELLRAQAPYERLARASALTRMVRQLAVAGIKQRHPDASEREVRVRLAVRLYGREAAGRLFGELPADAV
jgi:hypothetical protein